MTSSSSSEKCRRPLVIFDIDNTLFNYDYAHEKAMTVCFNRIASITSYDLFYIQDTFRKVKAQVHKTYQTALRHDKMLQLKKYLEYLGIYSTINLCDIYAEYETTFLKNVTMLPSIEFFFRENIKDNCNVVFLTNNVLHIQLKVLNRLQIDCDELVTSYEIGREKPNKDILLELCEKYQVNDMSSVFVIGDNMECDIVPATELGMNTLHITCDTTEQDVRKWLGAFPQPFFIRL